MQTGRLHAGVTRMSSHESAARWKLAAANVAVKEYVHEAVEALMTVAKRRPRTSLCKLAGDAERATLPPVVRALCLARDDDGKMAAGESWAAAMVLSCAGAAATGARAEAVMSSPPDGDPEYPAMTPPVRTVSGEPIPADCFAAPERAGSGTMAVRETGG